MPQHKELSRDDIWQMLLAVDAYDRENWLKIGMAIKSYLGDDGFALFDDWSKTADNCIFWPIPITDSGLNRSPILEHSDH